MTPLFGAIKICQNKKFADCFRSGNAISTGTIGCDPLVLNIGDLTDITEYVRTEDINKELQIRSK